jgi:hypothetical protein
MAKPIWTAIEDILEAHDGHLELNVASACCWSGELRIGLTNPNNAPARSAAFFAAGGGTPEEVARRLLADFHEWRKTAGTIPSLEELSPWLFEDGGVE